MSMAVHIPCCRAGEAFPPSGEGRGRRSLPEGRQLPKVCCTGRGRPSRGHARGDGSVPALPGRYTTTLPMHGCTCHGSKCTKKRVKPRGRTQARGVHRSLAAHRSGTAGSPGPTDADGTAIPLGDTVPSFAASNAGPHHGVSAECDLASRVETLLDVGPVDDVPEGLGVVGLDVLVLQVEGVLPHVQHEQWVRTEGNVALLVVELLDDQALTEHVPGEDGPAGTLDGGGRAVEVRAEGVEGAELVVDRGAQLALGLVATLGGEVLPEDGVVDVPTQVEGQVLLEHGDGAEVTVFPGLRHLLQGGVGTTHIGRVVLVMVQLHDLTGDRRLQGRVIVGQFRKYVRRRHFCRTFPKTRFVEFSSDGIARSESDGHVLRHARFTPRAASNRTPGKQAISREAVPPRSSCRTGVAGINRGSLEPCVPVRPWSGACGSGPWWCPARSVSPRSVRPNTRARTPTRPMVSGSVRSHQPVASRRESP